ncbi:uncharacterized protein LOC125258064 isoform X2 [Megalobrama amblycephala]|uniref:uncharacterized protein LOC125258064 isoform X2 n=1 Tax=Megalobrama amblycephala TaxID=75352 RepID=UPI002013F7C6|nr:uncharacterized protein LOC125258064 isoform X2 [Megalobrama amblycephala]
MAKELLPSAERTALLYHLSYLCLGNFPELERLIRKRALETQLLFGSSEALLLKCAGTSENFVTSLLPNLKVAAEKNKPELALKHLEKAKEWISAIIMDVKEIVKRYEKHNHDLCDMNSDIITEKKETEKQQHQTPEMKELQKIIDALKEKHLNISEEIEDYERKIEEKNTEMRELISRIRGKGFNIYSMIVPFEDSIISHIYKTTESTSEKDQLRALHADLSEITKAQKRLKEEEWDIQIKLMENELKLAKLQTENGQMPSVRNLDEVRKLLSQIQKILVQLQKFWEKVGSLLNTLKERTFAGEIWIEDLTDMKEEFLESIDAAKEEWTKFGINCMKANNIFSFQANEAYRFLEISPSSLSEEEWQKEHESVKEKLQNIKPNTACPASGLSTGS